MFNFLGTIFHKTLAFVVGSIIAVGSIFTSPVPSNQVSTPSSSSSQATIQVSTNIQTPINSGSVTPSTLGTPLVSTPPTTKPEKSITVTSPPKNISSPNIKFINPSIAVQGFDNVISINGTDFQIGATIKIGNTSFDENSNPTSNLISVKLPGTLNAGQYSITITNPDGGTFIFPNALTITAPQTPPPSAAQPAPQSTNSYQQQFDTQAAQQAQAQQVAQQHANQINALTQQYNAQYTALEQQIIDIKTKYYNDLPFIGARTNLDEANGEKLQALNDANTKIAQIQLQEQQLYLNYTSQTNALR